MVKVSYGKQQLILCSHYLSYLSLLALYKKKELRLVHQMKVTSYIWSISPTRSDIFIGFDNHLYKMRLITKKD